MGQDNCWGEQIIQIDVKSYKVIEWFIVTLFRSCQQNWWV